MSPERPRLSVVVPVVNEAESLGELCTRLRATLCPADEIIVVDDGSTDATREVVARLRLSDANLRLLGFRRNYGKSEALAAGFRRCRGQYVAMIDGDLQDEPGEIMRLVERLDAGSDLVSGWRRKRQDPLRKRLSSWLFNRVVSALGGVRFHDINCGLKVFRREVLDDIVLSGGFHRFLPLLAHWRGFRVAEVEVEHHARRHGKSRYGRERVLKALLDLVIILFLTRYEGRPGRYFVLAGALLGCGGLLVSAYIVWLRIMIGSIQSRFPLMALGLVLLVVGVQLFSLGLFGELLSYHFRSRAPVEPVVWEAGSESSSAQGEPAPARARAATAERIAGGGRAS